MPQTVAAPINYHLKSKPSIMLSASLSTIFNSWHTKHSNTNQDLVEKHLCNQGSYYEKYGRFLLCMQKKSSCTTTILTLFTVNKDEWNTKEDTGYSMKNAFGISACRTCCKEGCYKWLFQPKAINMEPWLLWVRCTIGQVWEAMFMRNAPYMWHVHRHKSREADQASS